MQFHGKKTRWITLSISVIPGWGHVLLRSSRKGILLFFLFLAALNLSAMALIRGNRLSSPMFWAGIAIALLLVACSFLDIRRLLFTRAGLATGNLARLHFREGIRHYLRGEYPEARNEFRCAVHLQPWNLEARMFLGMVLKRQEQFREARKVLRDCLSEDGGKWGYEIRQELDWIREVTPGLREDHAGSSLVLPGKGQ